MNVLSSRLTNVEDAATHNDIVVKIAKRRYFVIFTGIHNIYHNTGLFFDFINGFHDSANAISTVVATKY